MRMVSKKILRFNWLQIFSVSLIIFVTLKLIAVTSQQSFSDTEDEDYRSKTLLTESYKLSDNFETQKNRKKLLRSICLARNVDSNHTKVTLVSDLKKSLLYCHVPKVATSSWMLVFATMNSQTMKTSKAKEDLNWLLRTGKLHSAVMRRYSFEVDSESDLESSHPMFKFLFIRHPFERLVSAYHDKFVDDPDNLFIRSVAHREPYNADHILNTLEKFILEDKLKQKVPDVVSFKRFVKFVLFEVENQSVSHGTYHWMPYSDLCGMCRIDYDFIGKLETLQEDLKSLLEKFPLEMREEMLKIFAEKTNASRQSSSETSRKYFSQISKKLILKLYKTFELDFLIGGYPFPDEYLQLGL